MKKLLLLFVLFVNVFFAKVFAQAQTNSIDIGSVQQTNNPATTFNVWKVIAMSPDMANALCFRDGDAGPTIDPTTGATLLPNQVIPTGLPPLSPVTIGQAADVVTTYQGGWPQGTYLSCFPKNTYYTPQVAIPSFTACTMTIRRQFIVCSNTVEPISFNLNLLCDNMINNVVLDAGTANPVILYTTNVFVNGLASVPVTGTSNLAPGIHTIDIQCDNYEGEDGVTYLTINGRQVEFNPGGIAITGKISSANNVLLNNPPLVAAAITGPASVCVSANATLSDAVSNGVWTSSNTAVATITQDGLVTGVTPGSVSISYTVGTGNCANTVTKQVTVNPLSPAPTTSPVTYCQGVTAIPLTARGVSLEWYTAITGGTPLTAAPTPSTSTAGTTTYYVSQTSGVCESPRTALIVTVNPTPGVPTVSPVSYCQGATPTRLTASGTMLKWYTSATGGNIPFGGVALAPIPSTFTTGTTTYYVSQTTGTCEGPRAALPVTVNSIPAAPSTLDVTYCQGAIAVPLTASGTNLKWYTTPLGGTELAEAPTPSTTKIGTTEYYVSQSNGNCEGARRLLQVRITETPGTPITSNITYCQGAIAAPLTAIGGNLKWYISATDGTALATAPVPSTSTAGTTTYYVSQSIGVCESPRVALVVTINPTPAAPIVSAITYCQGVTAAPLTATGTNLKWYTSGPDDRVSTTAPTPSTASAGNTTYYVTQTTGTCESPRAALVVTVNPVSAEPKTVSPVTYCLESPATQLTATGTNLKWYTTATGGTASTIAPTPLTATVGNTTYYVTQTAGACESFREPIQVTVQICCKDNCTLTEDYEEQQQQINSLLERIATLENQPVAKSADLAPSSLQSVTLASNDIIVLNQNVPNPFAESTVISYDIPVSFQSAQIVFTSISGQVIKTTEIANSGKGQITVYASNINNGTYAYTLIVDGKTIDTKKMIKE